MTDKLLKAGEMAVCPNCDKGGFKTHGKIDSEFNYRCSKCQTSFDEFEIREKKVDIDGLQGLPKMLAEME